MVSWQTDILCRNLSRTRRAKFRDPDQRIEWIRHPLPAAPAPLTMRQVSEMVRGFLVETVSAQEVDKSGAVVYFHGGAFLNGITADHWRFISELSRVTLRPIIVPHYGRLPHHTVQDFVEWLPYFERWLAPRAPIHLMGDSSGAMLAALMVQQTTIDLVGVSLLSPWLDVAVSNPEIPDKAPLDPWLDPKGLAHIGQLWTEGFGATDPQVNPMQGDCLATPDTSLYVGDRDILEPDCRLWVRLAGDEHQRTLTVTEGSPHVFFLFDTPEAHDARRAIAADVHRSFDIHK